MAKEIIPKNSRYIPLTQQKWCCVPMCIQMVILKHGMPLISAEKWRIKGSGTFFETIKL
jgi:hypothetical protein